MTNNNTNKGFTMKSFNIKYIDPNTNREVTELDISADRLFDRDGETWFRYDHSCGWFNPETRQQEFREVEVITATACTDSAAKAAYFARWGTANE
jgi:hypothetical protein